MWNIIRKNINNCLELMYYKKKWIDILNLFLVTPENQIQNTVFVVEPYVFDIKIKQLE